MAEILENIWTEYKNRKEENHAIDKVYNTGDIVETLRKAEKLGAKILYPATFHEEHGFAVAEIEDSEGNRIGLHQRF